MATEKEFTVVGVSNLNGKFAVRYANSVSRAKVLARNGHTEIFMIELDNPGRKEDCVDALLDVLDNDNELCFEARECILAEAKEFGFVV